MGSDSKEIQRRSIAHVGEGFTQLVFEFIWLTILVIPKQAHLSRFVVATRDIEPLELVMWDNAAALGPRMGTAPVCLQVQSTSYCNHQLHLHKLASKRMQTAPVCLQVHLQPASLAQTCLTSLSPPQELSISLSCSASSRWTGATCAPSAGGPCATRNAQRVEATRLSAQL